MPCFLAAVVLEDPLLFSCLGRLAAETDRAQRAAIPDVEVMVNFIVEVVSNIAASGGRFVNDA